MLFCSVVTHSRIAELNTWYRVISDSCFGIWSSSDGGFGIWSNSDGGFGIWSSADGGFGIWSSPDGGFGIWSSSDGGFGIWSCSDTVESSLFVGDGFMDFMGYPNQPINIPMHEGLTK